MQQLNREARRITAKLNGSYHEMDEIQALFSELTGRPVDKTFGLFPPFYTDCGKNIRLGKNVFINAGCHFQDQGGITVGDNTMIGQDVYKRQTVRVADTAPAGEETIYYMLMFTLKNKETRMTERIAYTGTILLREAIAQAVADGVLTQEELDGVGVVFIDMTAGDEYDPVASGNARFMPATCKQVAFDQAAGEYPAGTQLGLSSGTADAQIYYTLDGTSPKLSSASLYNPANKLTLTEDVRILASARKAGLKSSEPASGAYTVHKLSLIHI